MPKARSLPSQEKLLELFDYEPDTGLLRWRYRPTGTVQWNAKLAGKVAGGPSRGNGRIVVMLGGRLLLAHRIIWKMVYGEDVPELDHEDTDPANNRLANLRPATHHQNMQNQSRHAGKELPKGVTICPRSGKYRVAIYLGGRQKHLGRFDDLDVAHAAYCKAAAVRGEFARFD